MDATRMYLDGYAAVERAILATIQRRPGGALLDVGCGDGRITVEVAEAAETPSVHAIEIGPSADDAAARGIEVARTDLNEAWPYEDQTFDVVHANQVIEHLAATDQFLREIRRVLKPDGYAIVCTNNLASWHNIAALLVGAQPEPCHVSGERVVGGLLTAGELETFPAPAMSHLRIFTSRALRELAEYHGLRSEVVRGVAYYPLLGRAAEIAARVDRRHAVYILHRLRPARR